ncbi:hypothetical protein [Arthrobacter sunyaminii]|uniref:Uncharacterized protein n=1 Tax=Arthrobacter sunyaminii TaxID=2816859 RepID=A0A975S5F2_9MICC|nr:hypothetical protein [Arthrobacter sunyaminii]MBO0909428.1 hypothetical protein [Arthrobacter sunyaminii]QWQ36253.1 hypothetical protein KG104_17795 [Arthrobacter sunyaminii]
MHNQDNGEPANPDTLVPPPVTGRLSPRWWLAVQSALIAYGLTLGAALVTMALLVLGFFLGGAGALNAMNDSAGSMGARLDGPSALAIYPFFLAAMALGGTTVLTVSSTVTDFGAPLVSVWVGVLPLALTAVATASLWRLGRRAERKAALESDGARWLYAGLTGLALAAFSVLLSLLVSLRGTTDTGDAFLTAASPSLVAGAVLLGTAASWAGRKREAGTELRWFRRAEAALPGLRPALRLAGCHYLAYTCVIGLALLVTALVHGGAAVAFAAPLWLPTASAWAFATGHLSAVANLGLPLSGLFPLTVGDLPVWASAAVGVLVLLLATAAAVLWSLSRGRNRGEPAGQESWLTLPAVFGLGGAVLSVISLVAAGQGTAGGSGFGPGAGTVGPAWWTFLVMAAWGLVIEAGSRTLAPQLGHLVPRRMAAFFSGTPGN